MPILKMFREGRKQKRLKQKISDTQALNRSASGQQVQNQSGQQAVNRAASRLGVNPGMQFSPSSPARRKGSGGDFR